MFIYLLDNNPSMVAEWKRAFKGVSDVRVICEDFATFMDENNVECVVSPANSYGFMDGGFDLAITEYFGDELMEKVQRLILKNYYGEQPVGTSLICRIPQTDKYLIHTPTMRVPSIIKDPMVVYHCMRSTMIKALNNGIGTIVIPAFGGKCGQLDYGVIADLMREAYNQITKAPFRLTWSYALDRKLEDIE